MRRHNRLRSRNFRFFYIAGAILLVLSITLVILYKVYNKRLNEISDSMLSKEQIIGLVPNLTNDNENEIESTGFSLSKTIEEVEENQIDNNETKTKDEEQILESETAPTLIQETEEEKAPEIKKELSFTFPVAGEIVKEFAMEKLIYSETLEEWTTHQGIDIKADRTTMVTASEDGMVVAIKNDPRYGLTVIIEHENGFKTVYSNLLTAEFVTEDEKVTKGQSIGTIGNSAIFEIADEPHLHFELIKDGEYVDPILYIK